MTYYLISKINDLVYTRFVQFFILIRAKVHYSYIKIDYLPYNNRLFEYYVCEQKRMHQLS